MSKLKVLHVAMSRDPSSGIVRQMISEQQAVKKVGLPWVVNIFVSNESVQLNSNKNLDENEQQSVMVTESGMKNTWLGFRLAYFKWLLNKEKDFDVILLRYSSYDPMQYWYLSKTKKQVFLVHHTLEVPELLLEKGVKNKLKALVEIAIGSLSIKKAKGQIGVTQEILNYEQSRVKGSCGPSFVYPNGLKVNEDSVVSDYRDANIPHLLFIASDFYSWHGLDIILASIAKSDAEFHLEVIGNVYEADRLCAIHDKRISLRGPLGINEIRMLASRADLGLSSFALYRKKMAQACTLKTREYFVMGLPVYSGHADVFPDEFKFYKNDECDIAKICQYAMTMKSIPRESVLSAAKSHIDKEIIIMDVYKKIHDYYKLYDGSV